MQSGGRSGQRDLLWTLVDIYGSRELFVNEYRSMLADRLLNMTDFDTEQLSVVQCSGEHAATLTSRALRRRHAAAATNLCRCCAEKFARWSC